MDQDSVQAAVYRGRVYWFWGDTLRMDYPLGLFRMAGATTPLPDAASEPDGGIPFEYFVDRETRFARAMMPLPERPQGVIWVSAIFTVPDHRGVQRLVGHYSRRKGLEAEYEQGIAVFDDDKQVFEPAKQLSLAETWRRPSGHPIFYNEGGTKWLLFGSPTPNVRVPATLKDVLDPARYEAFTCSKAVSKDTPVGPLVGADGKPVWRWQKELSPLGSKTERQWVKQEMIKPEHARFCPAAGALNAAAPADRVILHSGSVRWNGHRKRWLLVAGQVGGKPSLLGEVWYAEAIHPTGPFAHFHAHGLWPQGGKDVRCCREGRSGDGLLTAVAPLDDISEAGGLVGRDGIIANQGNAGRLASNAAVGEARGGEDACAWIQSRSGWRRFGGSCGGWLGDEERISYRLSMTPMVTRN
jgi:hypothetical protein